MEKLSNPQKTIEVIQKYNFNFQKKFGQNFLIDGHVLDKIIAGAGVTKDDFVLEIGPGIGCIQFWSNCFGSILSDFTAEWSSADTDGKSGLPWNLFLISPCVCCRWYECHLSD